MGDVDWSKRSYGGYYGGADAFSSMGDVDWSKRSVGPAHQFGSDSKDKRAGGLYRSWLSRQNSPAYAYHSMADTDWGWKKRGELTSEDDHEGPTSLYHNYLMKKGRGYKHRPNYGYSTRNYRYLISPHTGASRSRSIRQPRNYNYHSMADMDWGWKRKKRTGNDAFEDNSEEEPINEEELNNLIDFLSQRNEATENDLDVSKRYVGSLLKNEKKSIASLARSNEVGDDAKLNKIKRSESDEVHDNTDAEESSFVDTNDIQMDKRNIASVAREFFGTYKPRYRSRRGGLSSLARNGGIRSKIMRSRNSGSYY